MDTPDNPSTNAEADTDLQAILDRLLTGKSLNSELGRRVQERAERIRQEILNKHGVVNVAVNLIREGRDEE